MQVFTQSPRMWRPTNHKPEAVERSARARRAGIGGVVCHALYLCNLAAPDDVIYEKSIATMRNTVDAASAIGADAVIFHVGSHLGAGFEAGLDRTCAALAQILERCDGDTWLLMENSAGAGGTIGRSLEELQTLLDRLDGHPRLGVCLDSCHLYVSGYDVTDPARGRRAGASRSTADRPRPAARAARQRQRRRRSARTATATRTSSRARSARASARSSRTRAFPAPDAYLEVPGVDKRARAPRRSQKLRDLHARWTR